MSELSIRGVQAGDADAIWSLLSPIVAAGETYALPSELPREAVLRYWLGDSADHEVYVALQGDIIVGTYFIHPNQRGGGAHIANCGYATLQSHSGRGVGYRMCMHSLEIAKTSNRYIGMQYNFVISSNVRAVALWKRCGFNIVGTLPNAFFNKKMNTYVDVFVMFQLFS
jgi:GNAT superfamily N-acetyltransferase